MNMRTENSTTSGTRVSSVTDIRCLPGWQCGGLAVPNRSSDNEPVYQPTD